ncbi:MAG TPA: T9SS type A sorting domain-containing protein [Saprospiraceae bacterium]|nr:T9SS type A sorting domain-containing protein [Saprospiraceae bacterium]
MKKLLTPLMMLLAFSSFSQEAVLEVYVNKPCGEDFDENLTITLYEKDMDELIPIAESHENPATFNELSKEKNYTVKVNSNAVEMYMPTIRDIWICREVILGIHRNNLPCIIVGDMFNGSNGLSTLDLVLMQKILLGFTPLEYRNWVFIEKGNFNLNPSNVNAVNQRENITLTGNITKLNFISFQAGMVNAAFEEYCTPCYPDESSYVQIEIPDISIEAGMEYEVPIVLNSFNNKLFAYSFELSFNNLKILKIPYHEEGLLINTDTNENTRFYFYNTTINSYNTEPLKDIAIIRIKALATGKLIDFISLGSNLEPYGLYNINSCKVDVFNFQINKQPDCEIHWPPSPVFVKNYESRTKTGAPQLNFTCSQITETSFTDEEILNDLGECQEIFRNWNVRFGQEIHHFTQHIIIDNNYPIECKDTLINLYSENTELPASDLISSNSHIGNYSFSLSPSSDSIKTILRIPPIEYLTVYNTRDSTFCISKIEKVQLNCEESVMLNDTLYFYRDGANYKIRAFDFYKGEEPYCYGQLSDFEIAEVGFQNFLPVQNFSYSTEQNKIKSLKIRYKIDGVWVLTKIVYAKLIKEPSFRIICHNDQLSAQKPYKIAFFSDNFSNLGRLNTGFKLKNAHFISAGHHALQNINFDLTSDRINLIWSYISGEPVNMEIEDTLWTFDIIPDKDGKLSDFISLVNESTTNYANINDPYSTKLDLELTFKDVQTISEEIMLDELTIFPNPTRGNEICIQNSGNDEMQIKLFNSYGKLLQVYVKPQYEHFTRLQFPENLKDGIYLLMLQSADVTKTTKILVVN